MTAKHSSIATNKKNNNSNRSPKESDAQSTEALMADTPGQEYSTDETLLNFDDTLIPELTPELPQNHTTINQTAPAQTTKTHTIPTNLSHFKIHDILGKGGMGAVYKAQDLELERFVAIKMIQLNHQKPQALLDEAKTICKLNHPNIVTIYDIAREGNGDFIVMEWIDGRPLNNLIPTEGLALEAVLEYAMQIVAAVNSAHKAGIIHRDLKPQNIMIDSDNRVKVLDFGIAELLHLHPEQARKNSDANELNYAGTPHYMSPEQINGLALDQRSDLFSLGIVLYEMLCGVKPFIGLNKVQIADAINQGTYTPLLEHQPKLDKDMVTIVETLLQPDANARYLSAQKVFHELNALSHKLQHQRHWWHRQHKLSKFAIVMSFAALIGFSVKETVFPPSTQELIERQLVDSKKVAFLPFNNISGDPVLQIFSDGVAAMLSNDLSEAGYYQGDGATWVVPTNEISRMGQPTVEDLYKKFGIDIVVTGSVQHMGSTRNVILSVINGSDGRQLKSTQLSIDAEHLFEAQRDVRSQVIKLLNWQIPQSLTEQFATQKPQLDGAYKHYLEGQGYLYRYEHSDNVEKAIQAFESATSIDPLYGDAYAGLAQAQMRRFEETKKSELLAPVAKTVERLKQVDQQHRLLSFLQGDLALKQGQYNKAVKAFTYSIEVSPNFLKGYLGLSDAYQETGQTLLAEKTLLDAFQIMPKNNQLLVNLGVYYYSYGNYLKAIDYFEKLSQQAPNNYIAYLNASACYYLVGNIEQAITTVQKAIDIEPTADSYANLGTMYFILKDYHNAVLAYEKMITINDSDYVKWGNLADAYRFANNTKFTHTFEQAIKLAELSLKLNPNDKNAMASLAYYYANLHHKEKSKFYAQKIKQEDKGSTQFLVAAAYARLNLSAQAVHYLNFAINNQYSISEISNSPLFDNLKDEPSFQQLLNRPN